MVVESETTENKKKKLKIIFPLTLLFITIRIRKKINDRNGKIIQVAETLAAVTVPREETTGLSVIKWFYINRSSLNIFEYLCLHNSNKTIVSTKMSLILRCPKDRSGKKTIILKRKPPHYRFIFSPIEWTYAFGLVTRLLCFIKVTWKWHGKSIANNHKIVKAEEVVRQFKGTVS